ncbi:alpha-L-fucosidase [Aegicerativicinus sediminis]|uniref:alpha-L-fucosidase n=1 Tax=Aegicerativicinus sediminis TaxID=2893202 RepID=UPI001E2FF230|nr:alpha-L-fucosidase [Aegicerativicinus sediminis]
MFSNFFNIILSYFNLRVIFVIYFISAFWLSCKNHEPTGNLMDVASTMQIDSNDTRDSIILKAAHVVPTKNQLAALQDEFIAFVHYGPNAFTRLEWGSGFEDPKIFALDSLNTDQWCEAMKEAGMTKVILTAKHHDGFVLWQSRYTDHGVMSTDFQNGEGDILRELSESCQKYGLKLGVYLSPADLYQIESENGLYGNLSKPTLRTIPAAAKGRPFENKTTFQFKVDDYNAYFLNQLFEILTEYGPVDEVWFDGAHPKRKGGQQYDYIAWKELISTLAPNAVIFGKEDIRWCGNENGKTRETEWNVIPYEKDPKTKNHFDDLTNVELGEREQLYTANYLHYQPAETNTSIREGWFYRDDETQQVRNADDVFDMYERSVGGNSTFLLNIPPNREGRFSAMDVAVLKEVGERIKSTYSKNLIEDWQGPKELYDNDLETFVLLDSINNSIEIKSDKPVKFNRIVLQEDIKNHGERVEKFKVLAWIGGEWKEIAKSTNIGYKRILRFPEIKTDKLKFQVDQYRYLPAIATIEAHYYAPRPPVVTIDRTNDGFVVLDVDRGNFKWKPHGENSLGNLSGDYEIRYTTDGSMPTRDSQLFEGVFSFRSGEIKAVSVVGGKIGQVSSKVIGIPKIGLFQFDSRNDFRKEHMLLAFDDSLETVFYFHKEEKKPLSMSFNLLEPINAKSFIYYPSLEANVGFISKGKISTSMDGKNWSEPTMFEFGNIQNDPSARSVDFTKSGAFRYVKITILETVGNSARIGVAEIDLIE